MILVKSFTENIWNIKYISEWNDERKGNLEGRKGWDWKEEKKTIETYFKLFIDTSEVNALEIAVVKYPEGPPEGNTVSRCNTEKEPTGWRVTHNERQHHWF